MKEESTGKLNLRYYRKSEFFCWLCDSEFERLLEKVRYRAYQEGQVLFEEGDNPQVFFLLEGLVRMEREDATGEYVMYEYVKGGQLFPLSVLMNKGNEYVYLAKARTNIRMLVFPLRLFLDILDGNQEYLHFLAKEMGLMLEKRESIIQHILHPNAKRRVVETLKYLRDHLGEKQGKYIYKIPYPITIREISVLSASSTETVRQVLQGLEKKELLEYQKKQFIFQKKLN